MSSSFEFSIEIIEEDEQPSNYKHQESKIYLAIDQQKDQSFQSIIELQQLLKTQHLLLQYQQKRKNERIKQIVYNYMNAYSNYLWTRPRGEKEQKEQFIFLNHKDLITIHDYLPDQLDKLFKRIVNQETLPWRNDVKPSPAFIQDFMNFWPLWHLRVKELIILEIQGCEKIENTFQSEYTFAAKLLSNLRLNDKIQRFCSKIFQPVLKDLQAITEELVVDFSGLYEKWIQQIAKLPLLKRFIDGGDVQPKLVRFQLEEIFGKLKGEQQTQMLLQQMVHFQRKQSAISFLLAEVGEQQIPDGLNLRLSWLVWKKIIGNRKKLQNLATELLASIVEAYPFIPHEIKYVVRCFKECAEKKYGGLRYQDLKSFFNKVVFSQLFFAEFMNLYQSRIQSPENNVNLTLLALISQKIMFGQQFYEKFKFGFLNQIILHYMPSIKDFILGFISSTIHEPPAKFMKNVLISFQSIKFMNEILSKQLNLRSIQENITNTSHVIAGKSYLLKNIFVYLVQKVNINYNLVLKPSHKIKRILIQFLILIDKISEKNSMKILLEQYRCSEEDLSNNRPSVQLYAIYLQQAIKQVQLKQLIDQIQNDITKNRKEIERIKIGLEKQYSYSLNLQKMYMKLLNTKRACNSKIKIEAQINQLLLQNLGFQYEVSEGKICESADTKTDKTFKKCLHDICECFLANFEGVDGLYHLFWERVVEQLEKGVVPDNMVENAKSVLGQKLYQIMKLDNYMGTKDVLLFKQMQKHSFINAGMLDLPNYQAEEEIILSECQKLVDQLYNPICPDKVLKIFHQITLVFQNVILTTGSATDITADVQIPLMLITIIKCKVKNIATLIDFVEKFCSDEIHSSVLGQTLTLLKSVIYLIDELNHKKFNLTEEQYQNYAINSSYIIIE